MPRGGVRAGAGRPKGKKGATLREELTEVKAVLPVVVPPIPIIDADEKDAAEQANDIMQHAGQMMRAYRELMGKSTAPEQKTIDDYMRWANVVLRVASMLLPYQRPTYRSIEVRTDRVEDDRRRILDDPREELNRLIMSAALTVRGRMDAAGTSPAQSSTNAETDAVPTAPVDNGDGILS
jgi:hypothetical protein